MKVRTDFVTNSSSSSFIFKEYDRQYIGGVLKNHLCRLEEVGKNRIWSEWNIFPQYYQEHLDCLQSYFAEYENKLISDLLEYLFDAQYLYFCEREVNYLLCDILKEEGICKYAAVHMG